MDFQRKPLSCPRCARPWRRAIMRKLDHPSGAVLDVCDYCGGMWLDKAEVMLLYSHHKTVKNTLKVTDKKVKKR